VVVEVNASLKGLDAKPIPRLCRALPPLHPVASRILMNTDITAAKI
jgi:hypothetical protein